MKEWKEIEQIKGYFVNRKGEVINKHGRLITYGDYSFNGGYKRIGIRNNGKLRRFFVHRLVAKAFIPNKKQKPCVNHINGNKHDNRVENLEWVTYKENSHHAKKLYKKNKNFVPVDKNICKKITYTGKAKTKNKYFNQLCIKLLEEYDTTKQQYSDLAEKYDISEWAVKTRLTHGRKLAKAKVRGIPKGHGLT